MSATTAAFPGSGHASGWFGLTKPSDRRQGLRQNASRRCGGGHWRGGASLSMVSMEGTQLMGRIEKTVFISYRRTDEPWALAIFQDLVRRDYDVFIDYEGIASRSSEPAIFE